MALLASAALCASMLAADRDAATPRGIARSIDGPPWSAGFALDCREPVDASTCRGLLADWKEAK